MMQVVGELIAFWSKISSVNPALIGETSKAEYALAKEEKMPGTSLPFGFEGVDQITLIRAVEDASGVVVVSAFQAKLPDWQIAASADSSESDIPG